MNLHDLILVDYDFAFWKEKEQILKYLLTHTYAHLGYEEKIRLWKLYASATAQVEKELLRKRAKVEEEIEQLKIFYDLPMPSDPIRDGLISKIEEIEDSVIASLSVKIEHFQGEELFFRRRLSAKHPVSSELYFVGKLVRDKILWRMIYITIIGKTHEYYHIPYTESSVGLSDSPIDFDEDSLAHFQNCPVPPPPPTKTCDRTQNSILKLPAEGCAADMPQRNVQIETFEGGGECSESKRQLKNASKLYRGHLPTYQRNFESSSKDYTTSLKSIRKPQRGFCPYYSDFMPISSKATTPKYSTKSFFYWFLSQLGKIRNKESLTGEAN